MYKKMYDVHISTHPQEKEIRITQPDIGDGQQTILFHVDQTQLVIDWLYEAKVEITNSGD